MGGRGEEEGTDIRREQRKKKKKGGRREREGTDIRREQRRRRRREKS